MPVFVVLPHTSILFSLFRDRHNQKGNTALHYASLLGFHSIVERLRLSGARLDIRNEKNQTAVQMAQDDHTRHLFVI